MENVNISFSFDKIYYLNADVDNSTHRDLYQSICNYSMYHTNGDIPIEYEFINSKEAFKKSIAKIKEETSNNSYPLIHISTHGGKDGLRLPSGGMIHWDILARFLTEINTLCKNNLFVVFACCEGAYIALPMIEHMLLKDSRRRAPLLGYIAPMTKIKLSEIEIAYQAFYNLLFQSLSSKEFSLGEAIKGLQKNTEAKMHCYSCVQLFRDIVDSFSKKELENYRSNLALDTKVFNLLDTRYKTRGIMACPEDYLKLRAIHLNSSFYIDLFNDFRSKYFMIDLYPENEERFIKLDQILNWNEIMKSIKWLVVQEKVYSISRLLEPKPLKLPNNK